MRKYLTAFFSYFKLKGKLSMLSDTLKMPLLRLTNYASKSDHAVSHIKMTFAKDKPSQVVAELSTLVERSELSDIQSESIAGIFSKLIEEINFNFSDLPLTKIIFESDINLLGLDNDTLKITCRFDPNKFESSGTDFFTSLLDKAEQYELNQSLEHAVTNIELHLNRSKLRSVDLILDNSIPNDNFYQLPFSDRISNSLNDIKTGYEGYSMNVAPAIDLLFALTQRKRLQFLTGKAGCRAKLIKEGDTFNLNSVQDVLAQANVALNLAETAHISAITLKSQGRNEYTPKFELTTKQTDFETAGMIDLNHEIAKTYQYIFKMMLANYSFPQFARNWLQSIRCEIKLRSGRFILNFAGYHLIKIFDEQPIDNIQNVLHVKAEQFTNQAQIKEINLTTKDDKVLKADLSIDALDKKKLAVKGMRLTNLDSDDPKAIITRTFGLTPNGYVLEKERFSD